MYHSPSQKSHKKAHTLEERFQSLLQKIPRLNKVTFTKEIWLMSFFFLLFAIIIVRLFYLQVIQHSAYDIKLNQQHTRSTSVKANRGDIYALDKSGQPVKLTENMTLYDVALDPTLIGDTAAGVSLKPRLIELLTPVVYKHLCEIHGMEQVTPEGCVKNIETFANIELLPKMPNLFYYGSGIKSPEYATFDFTGFEERRVQIISGFAETRAKDLISSTLEEKIKIWIKERNYLGFFTDEAFLSDIASQNFSFIQILSTYYVYVVPTKITNLSRDKSQLQRILNKYGHTLTSSQLDKLFQQQTYKYIKLFSAANPQIAQAIKELKIQHYTEKSSDRVPVLHGVILEPYTLRYYPRGEFMSNILWYVDKNGDAYYGIEKYFDDTLKGTNGKIVGRSSSLIGTIGANDFEVIDAKDGDDVYLTIDIGIQKEVETIAQKYLEEFKADSISVLVFDPQKWQVKASVSAPTFNPNNYNDAYMLKPLGEEQRYIVDDLTYVDVPVYIPMDQTTSCDDRSAKFKLATVAERQDTSLKKCITKNTYGAQVFVDKNISNPFEPGSVFKSFTVTIGFDTDEIRQYDYYQDAGEVKVWPYTIKNADNKACEGNHTFLDALINSCNVGMIEIVKKVWKEIFYNYLEKFGFGKLTWIELAEEKAGFVDNETTVSAARFLNNSFGQGVQVTQIQLAAAYGALLNGGKYIQPTIITSVGDKETTPKVLRQVIRPEVSEEIKSSLRSVISTNSQYKSARIEKNAEENYPLGAKSWTAQIAFRWKYQRGNGWTQATFVGVVTTEDPNYLVLIWVSRPRSNQWGVGTSGKVFHDVAKFLIGYSLIE